MWNDNSVYLQSYLLHIYHTDALTCWS